MFDTRMVLKNNYISKYWNMATLLKKLLPFRWLTIG